MNHTARYREAGISLLETLVALSVIAVMATTIIVMADFGSSEPEDAAERLVRSLGQAREDAIVSGQIIGFSADPDGRGYRFYRYTNRVWQVERDHPAFEPVRFSQPLFLSRVDGAVRRADRADFPSEESWAHEGAEVWFDGAGFDLPFRYQLTGQDEALLEIVRDDRGAIRLLRPDEAQL